jgi:TolB protein
MIAFFSNRSGVDQIWRMNIESGSWGPNLTQLRQDTHHNRVNNFVSWSWDGRRLAFTRALDAVPSWSPDGRFILFPSDLHGEPQSANGDIMLMNADGSNVKKIISGGSIPRFTPKMSKLRHLLYTCTNVRR